MYIIKQIPEDFHVKEIAELRFSSGDYSYFLLKKKNRNTIDVVMEIARRLRINPKRIGFAGNKDKRALTEQHISIYKIDKNKVENLTIKDVQLKFFGAGKNRINLGDMQSNDFTITVRCLKKKLKPITFMENYFDEQRFGKDNCNVGKMLIKKKYDGACKILHLSVLNNDYVGALRRYGIRRLRFCLHSYQSFLFNECAAEYLKKYKGYEVAYSLGKFVFLNKIGKEIKIPLLGFLTEFNKDVKEIYERILEKEQISLKDFIIREIPELSLEGSERNLFVKIKNFKTEFSDDELNKGAFKHIQRFRLPKGSYATIVIKKMFYSKKS